MRRTIFSCSQKVASIIPVPVNLGQPLLGPDRTPAILKEFGLLPLISSIGWEIMEANEISIISSDTNLNHIQLNDSLNAKNCSQVGRVCHRIYDEVAQHAQTNNFLLILGGDHCIPIGTFPAIKKYRPSTGIVWVDAHADINTPKTSFSGNMHGMPVSFLLNLVDNINQLPSMEWFKPPYLNPRDIVYIGLRDLDPSEKATIKRLGIKAFTMYDIDRKGIGRVMEETVTYLQEYEQIHLSYDIDAIDPFYAPHTGTAVRGGLTFREGNYICEALWATGKMNSMELVEVNPSLHTDMDTKLTMEMAMTLIGSSMGQTIL